MTTLYKIDNKGKIRQWSIEIEGNKYRTIYGEKDGNLVDTEWTVCESKNIGRANETTPEEQAYLEVESIVKKQREKGYSESPKAKLDGVMLAKNYEDYKSKIDFPVYSQPKLDGIRCTVDKFGMLTRNQKDIVAAPHIYKEIYPIIKHLSNIACLDGELYNPSLKHDFNKICSLVKKTKPTTEDLEESEKNIQYWIYDCRVDMPFSKRWELLKVLVKDSKYIKLVPTQLVKDKQELDLLYEKYLTEGNEGQMVRIDAPYEGKRSKFLLKRKEFITEEFIILDIIEGIGNKSGKAGAMLLEDINGKTFHSNIKGTWEWLEQLLTERKEIIGKQATVQYFNLTPDGIPRFPYVLSIRDYE